jgi:hypothetical protein
MQPTPKVQSPAAVVGLSLVTLGVYGLFWYHRINREMRDAGRAHHDAELAASKPARSVWALVVGGFVIVPAVVSIARAAGRLDRCEALAGIEPRGTGAITALAAGAYLSGFALAFVPPGAAAVLLLVDLACWFTASVAMQRRLNAVWRGASLRTVPERPDEAVTAA